MKTAGIIRIIAGALAATFFTFVLVAVLSGSSMFNFSHGGMAMGIHVEEDSYSGPATAASRGTAAMEQVREIEIHWQAGSVFLVAGTGNTVTFEETASLALSDAQMMQYRLENGKLKIDYCARSIKALNMPSKSLTVTIPADLMAKGLEKIAVQGTSADVEAKDIQAGKIELESMSGRLTADTVQSNKLHTETTSGRIQLEGITANELDVESTSGEIQMEGKVREVEADCTSGGITLVLSQIPQKLEAETISGRIEIDVPDTTDGFTAEVSTVSGGFRCDFPVLQNGNRFTVNGGVGAFSLETVSGSIKINQLG